MTSERGSSGARCHAIRSQRCRVAANGRCGPSQGKTKCTENIAGFRKSTTRERIMKNETPPDGATPKAADDTGPSSSLNVSLLPPACKLNAITWKNTQQKRAPEKKKLLPVRCAAAAHFQLWRVASVFITFEYTSVKQRKLGVLRAFIKPTHTHTR